MSPDPVILAFLGILDGILLVISYLMYRRIRVLTDRFNLMAGSP